MDTALRSNVTNSRYLIRCNAPNASCKRPFGLLPPSYRLHYSQFKSRLDNAAAHLNARTVATLALDREQVNRQQVEVVEDKPQVRKLGSRQKREALDEEQVTSRDRPLMRDKKQKRRLDLNGVPAKEWQNGSGVLQAETSTFLDTALDGQFPAFGFETDSSARSESSSHASTSGDNGRPINLTSRQRRLRRVAEEQEGSQASSRLGTVMPASSSISALEPAIVEANFHVSGGGNALGRQASSEILVMQVSTSLKP
jgi:hypothetical protein